MSKRWTGFLTLAALLTMVLAAVPAAPRAASGAPRDETPPTPLALERAINRAFERGDREEAAALLEEFVEHWPNHAGMLYNLACARSLLGEKEAATSALYRAVKAGFRDFAHMQRDPDLEAIRGEPMYEAILEAANRTQGARAEDALTRWKRTHGESGYRYEVDEDRRLAFATALDATSHAEMRDMLQRQADQLIGTLFEAPPDYYVLVAIPTVEDARALFGGDDAIGGRYEHANRRLISRDIGGSLRHEFFHLMHYGHMERLGVRKAHALWVQEGLAALYEDYEIGADGSIRFLPNDRTNIVINRAKIGRLEKWSKFMAMTGDRFMAKAGANYPQARSMFEYIAEQGLLVAWYRAYVEHYGEEPTGRKAFEVAFGRPVEETEKAWRLWARNRPRVDLQVDTGDASLGITSGINTSNDGVLIGSVLAGSAASRSRLRRGDVIVSVDGEPTRSMRELLQFIGAKQVGDRVEVRARRKGQYITTSVVLRARRPEHW